MTTEEKKTIIRDALFDIKDAIEEFGVDWNDKDGNERSVEDVVFDIFTKIVNNNYSTIDKINHGSVFSFLSNDTYYCFMGDIMQERFGIDGGIQIVINVDNYKLGGINVPYLWFTSERSFDSSFKSLLSSIPKVLYSTLFIPSLKKGLLARNVESVNYLYDWFATQGNDLKIANLDVIKRRDPEYYDFLIKNFDIPTLEDLTEKIA